MCTLYYNVLQCIQCMTMYYNVYNVLQCVHCITMCTIYNSVVQHFLYNIFYPARPRKIMSYTRKTIFYKNNCQLFLIFFDPPINPKTTHETTGRREEGTVPLSLFCPLFSPKKRAPPWYRLSPCAATPCDERSKKNRTTLYQERTIRVPRFITPSSVRT